jgi:2-dehydro-3-deoxyglucarate aldolase/4-hydroxy-2-oxoheptanedioate aldolase
MADAELAGLSGNAALAKLRAGGYAFGTWVQQVRTPSIMRWIASSGFDFAFIDGEHSDFSLETIGAMCEMARATGLVPIVRPDEASRPLVNRIQDVGAQGLMFHDVTTRDEVEQLLQWTRYPPDGVRGSTSYGPAMDYVVAPGAELKRVLNDNTLLVVQIESVAGVENVDAILAGGGVDVVEVGRGDLSTALGVPLELRHPLVLDAIEHIGSACKRHGVSLGVNCGSLDEARDMIERGVTCVSFSNERRILLESYRAAVDGLMSLTR